jgi:hypothetical protein
MSAVRLAVAPAGLKAWSSTSRFRVKSSSVFLFSFGSSDLRIFDVAVSACSSTVAVAKMDHFEAGCRCDSNGFPDTGSVGGVGFVSN